MRNGRIRSRVQRAEAMVMFWARPVYPATVVGLSMWTATLFATTAMGRAGFAKNTVIDFLPAYGLVKPRLH